MTTIVSNININETQNQVPDFCAATFMNKSLFVKRAVLFLIFTLLTFTLFCQTEFQQYLATAKEKQQAGDYIHAIKFYKKALEIDSSSMDILWEYAQVQRAYKDYRKAAYYYKKVYNTAGVQRFPESLVLYGLMEKQCGNYDKAIEIFKIGKRTYNDDRKGYNYLKSKQEFSSCKWAKRNANDSIDVLLEHLPEHINTPDAEFAHRLHDNHLIYSSLRADSVGKNDEVYDRNYRTHLYKSKIKDGQYNDPEKIEDLFWQAYNSGNGSFSADGTRFYFSLCQEEAHNYHCKIMVANYQNGNFKNIDSLGSVINHPNANTTMPFVGELMGDEVLFFASDKNGGEGKMDIWYSKINNGNQYEKPINIKAINSVDNELSPYWEYKTHTLYFSSEWHNGFGGQDIFESKYENGEFTEPKNLGVPINSPANDLYYFRTSSYDSAYFSSNRLGVNYSKNPTCCSDIFMVTYPESEMLEDVVIETPKIEETSEDSLAIIKLTELNKEHPVRLYFHNDIPDRRSWSKNTEVNYIDSYNEYTKMIDEYQEEYAKGLTREKAKAAKEDINDFFINHVDQGVKNLEAFRDALLEELQKGRKIQLTVKGFASPLAKTDYNVNLTKRRIASLTNYLRAYDDGIFIPYLGGEAPSQGQLKLIGEPYGEYTADSLISDNPNDVQYSIYSRVAAMERRIEIQSIDIIKDNDTIVNVLNVQEPVIDLGRIKSDKIISATFKVKNNGDQPVEIENIRIPCDCNTAKAQKNEIIPGESITVQVTFNPILYKNQKIVKSVYLKYTASKEELRLTITAEVD